MGPDCHDDHALRYPGEWVATSQGRIVAHGRDFCQVAQDACRKARDIVFERIPDPRSALWQAPRAVLDPVPPVKPPPSRPALERRPPIPRVLSKPDASAAGAPPRTAARPPQLLR